MSQQTNQLTPVFIYSKEYAEEQGIPFKKSILNAVVAKEDPNTLLAYGRGHVFNSLEYVDIAPGIEIYYVCFTDEELMNDIIFAKSHELAEFLLKSMYNLELVKTLEHAQVTRTVVWWHGKDE